MTASVQGNENGQDSGPGWFRRRLARHFAMLTQLAIPAVATRLGIMALAMVDTAMVGHYATRDLAMLNLASQSLIMMALVAGMGLLMGVLVMTAAAYGEERYTECGAIWRRTMPFAMIIGLVILAIAWPADRWLEWFGQTPETATEAGDIVRILALGIPGHFFFLTCSFFLEGVKYGRICSIAVIGGNLLNIVLNWLLIYGSLGAPELGAEGSAWASTAVRWGLGIWLVAYIWFTPAMAQFGVRSPVVGGWASWAEQRHIGYAASFSICAEASAFAALAVFAGWLGTIPLAAHGVMYQLLGIPLMACVGIGVAGSVRVGMILSRGDRWDLMLVGLTAILMTGLVVGLTGAAIVIWAPVMMTIFTNDSVVVALLVPVALLFTIGMVFDGAQMVASFVLRGLKETWWPTIIQTGSFVGVMLPASYWLAFPMGLGFKGLVIGTLIGVLVAFILLVIRFILRVRKV